MSETTKLLRSQQQSWDTKSILTVVICTVFANFTRDMKWMRYPFGLLFAYLIVLLIGYWIGQCPPESFGRFAFRVIALLLMVLAGLWAFPELLSKWIRRPLAYGLPVLAFGILCYWMPPPYPKRKPNKFWMWLLWCVGFAILFGYIGKP